MGLNGPLFWYFMPVFVAMVLVELWVLRRRGLARYSLGETFATLGIGLGQRIIGAVAKGSGFGLLSFAVWQVRLATIPMHSALSWVALFIGVEFTYYWFHRSSHEVRWLWATHAVHHTPEELNILASYRLGWTGLISGGFVFHLPLMLIGFHPVAVATMLAANLFYQSWLHTVLIARLPLVEGWLNTPSSHRVHHGRNADYLDRNHGGVTLVFDRLFGTYVAERDDDPVEFGLVTPVGSVNPVTIAFHEWQAIARDLRAYPVRHWPGLMFGPPGWRPDGAGLTSAAIRAAYRRDATPQGAVPAEPVAA